MMQPRHSPAWFLAAFCLAASPAAAQLATTPRAAGLAGAYVALARGSEAVNWNPANLALPGQPIWSVTVPNLAVTGAALGPPLGELRTLTHSDLTDAERQAFLDHVPQAGLHIQGGLQVPWAGVSVGRFAFGVSSTALLGIHAGREMVDLYLEARQNGGVDPQRLDDYGVGDTGFRGAVLTSAAVAYGHAVPFFSFPASVGVTGRFVLGHDLQQGRIFEPVETPNGQDILITMLTLGGASGHGFGLDLGAAARPVPGLTIGLAAENLVQYMSWGGTLELRGGEFTGTELGGMGPGDFNDRFEPRPYDPATARPEADSMVETLVSGASPPRIVRLGAAYQTGGTALGVTGSKAVGRGKLFTGWPQYLALGVEQRFGFLALRGGVASSLAGATAFALGTGFSLGNVQIMLSGVRSSGSAAAAPAASSAGFDFPGRLAAASGYSLMLGLDVSGPPTPPRRPRRRR